MTPRYSSVASPKSQRDLATAEIVIGSGPKGPVQGKTRRGKTSALEKRGGQKVDDNHLIPCIPANGNKTDERGVSGETP